MRRWLPGAVAVAAGLAGLACGPAFADRASRRPAQALAIAPAKVRAPYDVTILDESGNTLSTYAKGGRYYVLGDAGDRYIIRVSNPTPNRVEAVITVDGLDVIDGENGDLRKRGYIVPPYGDLRIEGFRTSTEEVATFRFSSVDDSYAGRKGKARNVGVIAVALFEEVPPPEPPQVIIGGSGYGGGRYYYEDDLAPGSVSSKDSAKQDRGRAPTRTAKAGERSAAKRAPAPPPAAEPSAGVGGGGSAPGATAPTSRTFDSDLRGGDEAEACCGGRRSSRPGLGTEFGEQRYSAAQYTRFVRANGKPIAVAELRYNDAAGLIALGVPVQPIPDHGELSTRETADPFPGDGRFASPPR